MGERLVPDAHVPHGLHGRAGGAGCEDMGNHDHCRHCGEAQCEARADAESRPQPALIDVLCVVHAT
jgi:hypothetical protein